MKVDIIRKLKYVLVCFLLSSCSLQQNIEEDVDFQLHNFNLSQLDNKGNELFRLKSSIANIDNKTQDIFAKDVKIRLSGDQKLFNKISSDNCLVVRSKNVVILSENVKLTSDESKKAYLIADKLVWYIDKSNVNLNGNINLSYFNSILSSDKANYDDNLKQIEFEGLTKYIVYNKDNNANPIIRLTSEKAIINYKSKQIDFLSVKDQVKSVVNLEF